MEHETPESGLDELMRLSQQFTKQEQEHTAREQQRANQRKKTQDVLQGLKELNVSMAVGQLKMVATPDIVEAVNSLKGKQGTEDLRKLISDLTGDLENRIGIMSASNPEMIPLEKSVQTLAILIELLFSFE